jgi:hypothetical protein
MSGENRAKYIFIAPEFAGDPRLKELNKEVVMRF